MKSFLILLSILLSAILVSGQTELEQKALSITQSVSYSYNISPEESVQLELLSNKFASGVSNYEDYVASINTLTADKAPIETQPDITGGATLEYNGNLEFGPYIRRYGVNHNPSNLCNASSLQSQYGSSFYYDIIEFKVFVEGDYEIKINSMTGTTNDSYLYLYCDFDPSNPADNLVDGNDDGISIFGLSKIELTDLPAGDYKIVVTTFASYHQNCEFNLSVTSNGTPFMLDGKAVPINFSTIIIAFTLLFIAGIIRFKRRIF